MKKVACERWVTESVLVERINERLADNSRTSKELQMEGSPSFGHFYEQPDPTDEYNDSTDLESMGREMGVLAPDEGIAHVAGNCET